MFLYLKLKKEEAKNISVIRFRAKSGILRVKMMD